MNLEGVEADAARNVPTTFPLFYFCLDGPFLRSSLTKLDADGGEKKLRFRALYAGAVFSVLS